MDGGKRALTSMSQLICLGLGYAAEHYVAAFRQQFDRIVGTMRSEERAAVLNADDDGRLQALVFDGQSASPKLQQAIVAADAALISIPQDAASLGAKVQDLTREKVKILLESQREIERLTREHETLREELESAGEMIERLGKELELT